MIGRVERVPLREVWRNEEYDFTKWLLENLDLLGEEIGIRLEGVEAEAAAGDFRVDIVAKRESGEYVVIENQLEKSDHAHLGKLLTYLSMWDANTAIWIVGEPRAEHVSAVNWLNEMPGSSFYMLKIEAIRIGESEPAPLLTRIVGPSEEVRDTQRRKREQTEAQERMQRFWKSLMERARQRTDIFNDAEYGASQYLIIVPRMKNAYYYCVVTQYTSRVEIYISWMEPDELEQIFDHFYREKDMIEKEYGGELEWIPAEGRKSCKIVASLDTGGYLEDESEWPEMQDAMIDATIRLNNALKPHIEHLIGKKSELRRI